MRERWSRTGHSAAALRVAVGYALLATVATALALALRDGLPWVYPDPWFPSPPAVSLVTSAVLGLALATALIALTRVAVARYEWARRLHCELRPVARDLTAAQILLVAGLSSLGEELLFRGLLTPTLGGLLTPTLGIVISALLFGLAHQIKGPSRWVWVGWATGVGAGLGAMFVMTGSLVGPLLAHAIVNAVNLTYLRDHDPGAEDPQRNPA